MIIFKWAGKEGFDFLGMYRSGMATETKQENIFQETYQYPSRKSTKKI